MTSHVAGQEASTVSRANVVGEPDATSFDAAIAPRAVEAVAGTAADAASVIDASSVIEDGASDADLLSANSDPAPATCASDGDCVLVTGGCAGPMAAHRTQAEAIDARHQRMRGSAYCGNAPMARPIRAVCTQSRCVIEPMDHPEWRLCERTRECVAIRRRCSHWQSINRRFEREARDADRPCTESGTPEPAPRIECQYGWCVAGWGGR